MSICRDLEKVGHRNAARRLRGALRPGQLNPTQSGQEFPGAALAKLEANVRLKDVVLAPAARSELVQVVREWRLRDKLRRRGVPNRAKLLFHGPPGCGKSITARALGHELELPVFVVRFDAVIGAYLGQTAIHLRQLFNFAERLPCVLLLDEIDALGKRRGNPLDVGELDRIVISLMQELEHSAPSGLVVATSNLPRYLDDALWRRFDLSLAFKSPTQNVLRRYVREEARNFKLAASAALLRKASKKASFAAARAEVLAEVRSRVITSGAQ